MREILHKAKLKNWETNPACNKWVEGFYCNKKETTYCMAEDYERFPVETQHYIIQEHMTDWGLPNEFRLIEIDPETLCEHTRVSDRNGNGIWENDIVQYNTFDGFDCQSVVDIGIYTQDGSGGEYGGRRCMGTYVDVDNFTCPDWADNDPTYFSQYMQQENLLEVANKCEVIGNIFDNPEIIG